MSAKQSPKRSFWAKKLTARKVPKKYNSAGNKHGRFSVSMPADLVEAAHKYCAENNVRLSAFVATLIHKHISQ